MKKKVLIIIGIILLMYILPIYVCNAADDVIYNLSSTGGTVGDTITVVVEMKTDGKFVAADYILKYDAKSLQYVSHKEGEALTKGAMNMINKDIAGVIKIAYVGNPSDKDKTVKAGNVITIQFKVLKEGSNIELISNLSEENGNEVTSNASEKSPLKFNVNEKGESTTTTTEEGEKTNGDGTEIIKGNNENTDVENTGETLKTQTTGIVMEKIKGLNKWYVGGAILVILIVVAIVIVLKNKKNKKK